MTTNMAIFERVARREITPEAAATTMMQADTNARRIPRPAWAGRRVWALGVVLLGVALALIGIRREDRG